MTDKPVAPRSEVYEYIIFRASDIKDLLVEDPPTSPGLSDPAIIQAVRLSFLCNPHDLDNNVVVIEQQSVGGTAASTSFPSPTSYGAPGSGSPSVAGLIGSASSAPVSSPGQRPGVPVSVSQEQTGNKSRASGGQLSNVLAAGSTGGVSNRAVGSNRASGRTSPGVVGTRGKSPSDQRQRQPRDGSGGRGGDRPQRSFNDRRGDDNNRSVGGQGWRGYGQQNQQRDQRQRQGQGFQDRRPRDSQQQQFRGGNQRSDWPGSRPHRQNQDSSRGENRPPPRTRPPMLDVRKLEEFDFEKANAEFVELTKEVEDLKISDDKKTSEGDAQDSKDTKESISDAAVIETYNKTKSFFDSISCESIERSKGNNNRVDRRQERKQNTETFGVAGIYNRNWRGRGGRYNNNNRFNNNRFNSNDGDRRGFNRNHNNSNRGERVEKVD